MDAIILNLTEVWTLSLLIAACIALPSGILQGYAGFGGALFASPLFTLLFGPVTAFSILVILMLFSQMPLYPGALRQADWREFAPVSASSAVIMPLGVFFLVSADPSVIRRGMGVMILFITIFMMFGYRYRGERRMLVGVATGSVTGAISGFFGVPAFPLAAIYLHNAALAPGVIRANVLSAICCTLSMYLIVLSLHGVYDAAIIIRAVLLTPIFAAGVYCGQYLFRIAPVEWFKKATYGVLICTAVMMLGT